MERGLANGNPREAETVFNVASQIAPEDRAAYLDRACAGQPQVRAKVEALLRAQENLGHFLPERLASSPADLAEGQCVGRYKLLEKIGEGGCGVVYLAEQQEPVRRSIALKVIKLGMDTKAVIARFEAERQALAVMDHPNIAKVLDAGATDTGRPYFVMELVRGIKITEYCAQHGLSTQERLNLFIKICQAIQHAHQKGIIHRDIKPSNILVTLQDNVAVPKVIDFGIAKAIEGGLTENTAFTAVEQFIGTPAYMSPEQALITSEDIDTRSDIYSLGVLLYELIAGQPPFNTHELLTAGLNEMRRIICEKEPLPPSRMVLGRRSSSSLPSDSKAAMRIQKSVVDSDLDCIIMKCLEKDRARRYETANGLAADLNRYLGNEPIVARAPTAIYRFRKILRRNQIMAGAIALVLVAIVLGAIISIGQTLRARKELERALVAEAKAVASEVQAQVEKANAQAALHFLQDDVLNQASPAYQPDRDIKLRAVLDSIAERLELDAGRPPLVVASIRQTLGSVYTELGEVTKAVLHYERAFEIQRRRLGEQDLETMRSLHGLAIAYWLRGDLPKADPLTREGLEQSRAVLGEKHPLTLQFMQARAMTLLYTAAIPWTELEPLFLEALALHREVFGPDDLRTLRLSVWLSVGYNINWQPAKAEPLTVDSLERARRVIGEKHPETATLTLVLGYIYANLNQPGKAEPLALASVEARRGILGEENFSTMVSVILLARVYVQQQKFDQAQPLTEQVINLSRRLPIKDDLVMPWKLSLLAGEYLEQGQVGPAATLSELALEALRQKPNPQANAYVITQMAEVRLAQQKYGEAESLLRESSPLLEKQWPGEAYLFHVMSLLGASLSGQQKYAEAEPLLLRGFEGLQQRRQSSTPAYLSPVRRIEESLERLVQLYDAWGKPSQAAEWRQTLEQLNESKIQL